MIQLPVNLCQETCTWDYPHCCTNWLAEVEQFVDMGNTDMSNVHITYENIDCITCARFFGLGKCGVGFLVVFE